MCSVLGTFQEDIQEIKLKEEAPCLHRLALACQRFLTGLHHFSAVEVVHVLFDTDVLRGDLLL